MIHLDVFLWFILPIAKHKTRLTPNSRELKSVRWFDVDEQRDWPAGTYDPEMHRFAAKLRPDLRPRGSKAR